MIRVSFVFCTSLSVVLLISPASVMSLWEFAVSTNNHKINFYDDQWSLVTAVHHFPKPSSIAFDETEERIYFHDKSNKNVSIFSIRVSLDEIVDGNTGIESVSRIVKRIHNETIKGIAYDPLDRQVYWTDSTSRKIYTKSLNTNESKVLIDFVSENADPDGIAVDFCNRQLYWTNSEHNHASIGRSSLDGTNQEIIIKDDLHFPHGIVVDQFTHRIFWVVDQHGTHYSVESAYLNGTDRMYHVKGLNSQPFHLTVTRDGIYWTDIHNKAIWNISKTASITEQPKLVLNLDTTPSGIISRQDYLIHLTDDLMCKDIVKTIKSKLLQHSTTMSTDEPSRKEETKRKNLFCLNNGEYNVKAEKCFCVGGFKGVRCEVNECHNYCLHGYCTISQTRKAHCTCNEGYHGNRCEKHKCDGYCVNNMKCEIINDEPICHCQNGLNGGRCENNQTATCSLICQLRKYRNDIELPFSCTDFCDESSDEISTLHPILKSFVPILQSSMNLTASVTTQSPIVLVSYNSSSIAADHDNNIEICNSTYNITLIIIISGVTFSLIFVYLIIKTIRKIYKPARPRIKKTFVVQKKIRQTPLTSRPISTEQCEITIENCCNMNICETPCFDPTRLQQNISSYDGCSKEDKKMLINNDEENY